MSESNRKKIKLLGFEPVQKAIVASLATLSRSRSIQYNIISDDDIFESDILLIDVHDQVVIENWQQLKDIVGDLPVIAIGEESVAGATVWVKRSQLATKLLDAMDGVLVKDQTETEQSTSAGPALAEVTKPEPVQDQHDSVPSATPDPALGSNPSEQTTSAGATPAPGVFMVPTVPESDLASVALQQKDGVATDKDLAGNKAADAQTTVTAITVESEKAEANQIESNQANTSQIQAQMPAEAGKTKEALDDELRSAIAQIREGSTPGGGGAIVDNEAPDYAAGDKAAAADTTRANFNTNGDNRLPQPPVLARSAGAADAPANDASQSDQNAQDGSAWPKSIVSAENSQHKNRFLIVDDSPYVWTQLRICLEHYDVDLDFVSAAEDGLEEVRKRDYDLVFMDVMLPKMNGYDACKLIKKNRASKHIPVIMLTGRSAPANKLKGVLSGCNYYLTKPVSEAEVKAVVDRFYTKVLKKSA